MVVTPGGACAHLDMVGFSRAYGKDSLSSGSLQHCPSVASQCRAARCRQAIAHSMEVIVACAFFPISRCNSMFLANGGAVEKYPLAE